MSKSFSKSFYNSKVWKDVRELVRRNQYNICGKCDNAAVEEVHHIKKLTPNNIGDPEITLSLSNLIGLCYECHKKIHIEDLKRIPQSTREGFTFDDDGNLIEVIVNPPH